MHNKIKSIYKLVIIKILFFYIKYFLQKEKKGIIFVKFCIIRKKYLFLFIHFKNLFFPSLLTLENFFYLSL